VTARQSPNPARLSPNPARLSPSPARQSPSPARQSPSPARWPRPALFAAGVLVAVALTGCAAARSGAEDTGLSCPARAGGPVTVAVGARANSPAPVLPAPVVALMREAAKQGNAISLVRVDGSPSVAFQGAFRSDAANDVARRSELDAFVRQAVDRVGQLEPQSPEADVLAALNESARITPAGGTVVLLDSGLQTTGQLRFQDPGTFGADPSEVVGYLGARGLLPGLSARSVVLAGLGNTAQPQAALDQRLRGQVTAIWKAIVDAAHPSCVDVLDTAGSRASVTTPEQVSVVTLPSVQPFAACGTTVLTDGSTVGFLPDQAVFRDRVAARTTLQGLAVVLLNGRQRVELIGTTSSAGTSEPSRVQLSLQRAQAVEAVLVELGVPAGRITTRGAGSRWLYRVNDRGPDGALIPAAAARNRSVVVRLSC
jgi:OmpA-OmpF porin, OOP family